MDKSDQGSLTSPTELRCITCGYDLRSLPTEESCPECGTSIELSRRGDLLSQSDPAWVARLARGQSVLVWGLRLCLIVMVSVIVVPLLGLGLGFAFGLGLGINIPSWVFEVLLWSFGSALIVGTLVATLGCSFVTTQDPRDSLRESSISTRNVARRALLAMYGCGAIGFVAGFVPFVGSNPQIYAVLWFLPVGICLTVAVVVNLGRLAVLAARIPDHDLRSRTMKSARFFRWAIPIFILLSLFPQIGFATSRAPAAARGWSSGPLLLYSLMSCVSMIVTLSILIGSIRMYNDLFTYRAAFRRCAAEANAANSEQPLTD